MEAWLGYLEEGKEGSEWSGAILGDLDGCEESECGEW